MAGGGLKKKKGKKQGGSPAQPPPKKQAEVASEEDEDGVDEEETGAEGGKEAAAAGEAPGSEGAAAAPRKSKSNRIEEAMAKADEEEDEEDDGEPRGVIYLGHIPSGFCEPQMKKFFRQFGKLTRWRLARSWKNAAPQGYAFIEFEREDVAKIVADTMNNYMMFGKKLVCKMVPREKVGYNMFPKNSEKLQINRAPARKRRACAVYNDRPAVEVDGEKIPQTTIRQAERRKKKEFNLKKRLKELGIDFDPSLADADKEGSGDEQEGGAAEEAAAPPLGVGAAEGGGPPAKQPKKKRRKQEEPVEESEKRAEAKEPPEVPAEGGDAAPQEEESAGKPQPRRKLRKIAKRAARGG